MISCNFFGGLGNNLFQLATVIGISEKYKFDLSIPSKVDRGNISIYNQSDHLEFLDLFENEFIYDDIPNNLRTYIHPDFNLSRTDYSFVELPIQDNTIYHGYFQSEKYFSGIDIKEILKLKKENIDLIKDKFNSVFDRKTVSLHYRLGGDRVTNHMQHYHKNVSVDYYKTCIDQIKKESFEDFNVLIFTDNMKMCKEKLSEIDENFIYIDNGNSNVLDFTFMSLCDINIVGNSTFSWWGAYLNQNVNNTVFVTESEWFGPGYKHFNLKDTFPEKWIRI
jgi:hypothetical protein